MVTFSTGTFALVGSRGPFLPVRPFLVRGGRGRRGGSEGLLKALFFFVHALVAALDVDNGSVFLLPGCSVFPSVDDWPQMLGIMAGDGPKGTVFHQYGCALAVRLKVSGQL